MKNIIAKFGFLLRKNNKIYKIDNYLDNLQSE